jgi:antitoxin HicB
MLNYPVTVTEQDNEFLIDFVDFPFVHTVGDTLDVALAEAVDALESGVAMLVKRREPVPAPSSPAPGQHVVTLPFLVEVKVALWNEMLSQKLRKADLARKLEVHAPQIDRLFDFSQATSMDLVEQAAKALGRSPTFELR